MSQLLRVLERNSRYCVRLIGWLGSKGHRREALVFEPPVQTPKLLGVRCAQPQPPLCVTIKRTQYQIVALFLKRTGCVFYLVWVLAERHANPTVIDHQLAPVQTLESLISND
jgi:hypothetical protein